MIPALVRSRGHSLVETLLALFLLGAGSLACVTLFIQASRIQRQSLQGTGAARVMEECQASIQEWGREATNFVSGSLYNDLSLADSDYPGFRVRIQMQSVQNVTSPNPMLELPLGSLSRTLTQAIRPYQVRVSWGVMASQTLTFAGQLSVPQRNVRNPRPIQISLLSGSSSMAINATATYQAELMDDSNQVIPGVTFGWILLPDFSGVGGAGLGSLDSSIDRTGRRCALIHHYYAGDPTMPAVPGWSRMRAYCRYFGREYVYDTDPIELQ
jgi:hypothetical protein